VTATVPVGNSPANIAVNPNAKTIYVTNEASDTVSVLAPCRRAHGSGRFGTGARS
jgi:DNA-binding beta-propeller fold protein YncE